MNNALSSSFCEFTALLLGLAVLFLVPPAEGQYKRGTPQCKLGISYHVLSSLRMS